MDVVVVYEGHQTELCVSSLVVGPIIVIYIQMSRGNCYHVVALVAVPVLITQTLPILLQKARAGKLYRGPGILHHAYPLPSFFSRLEMRGIAFNRPFVATQFG